MTARIGVDEGIVVDVAIPIEALRVTRLGDNGIGGEEAAEHRRVPAGLVVIEATQAGLEGPLPGVVAIGGISYGLLRAGRRPRLPEAGAQGGRRGRGRGRVPGGAERGVEPRLHKRPPAVVTRLLLSR